MKSRKFKFIIGTLIIALVISVLPMGLVANAAKGKDKIKENKKDNTKVVVEKKVELITEEKAIEIAIAKAVKETTDKDELAEIDKIKSEDVKILLKNNIYYIEFSTGIYKYVFNVNAKSGYVSYYNKVFIIENDRNLKNALKAAYDEIIKDYEDIDYKDIKIVKAKSFLDAREPYYIFELKTERYLYEIKVIKEDYVVKSIVQTPMKEEKDEDEDEDKDKYDNLRPNELNQLLNIVKKEVIQEFQNAKKDANKSDKKQAIADFKAQKDIIKIARKTGVVDHLKDLEIEFSKKPSKPINEVKNLTKEQVEEKAREKINARGLRLDSIELIKDNNPQVYKVKMYNDNYEYELKVHATTGAILEYLRVAK